MNTEMHPQYLGSDFDDFLKEEGMFENIIKENKKLLEWWKKI